MTAKRLTVAEVERRIREGIRRSLDGLDLLDDDGPEIVVERDPENQDRVNCSVPVRVPYIEHRYYFRDWPEPIGCRR